MSHGDGYEMNRTKSCYVREPRGAMKTVDLKQ